MIWIFITALIIVFFAAYFNFRAEYRIHGNNHRWYSDNYRKRDRIYRYVFIGLLMALFTTASIRACGQSTFVGYSQRYQATVAIDTLEKSATIVTPTDTIVLYGSRVINHNGLILLTEGERTLARICTSSDCSHYPQATWCAFCGNQRRRHANSGQR